MTNETLDLAKIEELGLRADVRRVQVPHFEIRASDDPKLAGVISGLAVPYNTVTERTGWGPEQIATGAITNSISAENPIPLRMEHAVTVGTIFAGASTDAGYEIQAQILPTRDGKDLIILIDGKAIRSFSIGFFPKHGMRDTETGLITWDEIELFEVSAVTTPAYESAAIQAIRSALINDSHEVPNAVLDAAAIDATPTQAREADHIDPSSVLEKESNMTDDNTVEVASREDIAAALTRAVEAGHDANQVIELKAEMAELTRSIALLSETTSNTVVTENRTGGAFLRDLAKGDEPTKDAYSKIVERAWNGEVIADTDPQPVWVTDLVKIIDKAAPLKTIFASGVLPENGMTMAGGVLKNNTLQVAEQVNEGDDLVYGKVSVDHVTWDIKTFGGYTSLTRKIIDRAPTSFLDLNMRGMSIAAGQAVNGFLRSTFVTARAAQAGNSSTNKVTLNQTTGSGVDAIAALIDAAGIAQDNGVSLDNLVADKGFFKWLMTLKDAANRPFFIFNGGGQGVNGVGSANPAALKGDLAGVTVTLDPGLGAGQSAFVSSDAIRLYTTNGVQLQDDNIINLTRAYSIYFYGAAAVEIPEGIIPIVGATS